MNKEFVSIILPEDGLVKAQTVATIFDDTLNKLNTLVPDGREYSLVKTKLEEACFYAKKAMALTYVAVTNNTGN